MLAALDQRITVRYALAGMTATETADYITHHVKIAGRRDTLFSDDAVTLIHNASRGYPRAVNNLAVNALTAAFAATRPSSTRPPPASPSPRPPPNDHHASGALTTTAHPDDQAPSGTPPTGPAHVPDIGIPNGAVVCTLSGGQQLHAQQRYRSRPPGALRTLRVLPAASASPL